MAERPTSLCDTDLYKLTMQQVVLHKYSGAIVRYEFKWRNWSECKKHLRISVEDFIGRLKERLDVLCELMYSDQELSFLNSIPFLKSDFIEYLRLFRLNRRYLRTYIKDGEPRIRVEGPWVATIPFEVPVLHQVSNLYTNNIHQYGVNWLLEGRKRLKEKLSFLSNAIHRDQKFIFSDFGTRRRASLDWHNEVISFILDMCPQFFVGTSNVMLAMKYGVKPVGTMAHEYLQAHQRLGPRLIDSQAAALQAWADEYRGDLGIALSDVLGFEAFLKDFDLCFAKLFDGCRHDSGDPIWWCEKLIEHYQKMKIEPRTKSAVFSDGLNFETAVDLFRRFHSRINVGFGIGTYLTNDCGFVAPQIVMKMVECNGMPVAKVSDSAGKGMCEDESFETYLKEIIRKKIDG